MNFYYDTEFLEGTQKTLFGKTVPTIDLISIGIVAEDGRELYLISNEFNLKEAWNRWQQRTGEGDRNNVEPRHYWIRENVLRPIFNSLVKRHNAIVHELNCITAQSSSYSTHSEQIILESEFSRKKLYFLLKKYGNTREEIAEKVKQFVYQTTGINDPESIANWEQMKDRFPINFYGYYSAYDHVALCWLFGKMIELPKGFPMYTRDLKQTQDETQFEWTEKLDQYDRNHYCMINHLQSVEIDIRNLSSYPGNTGVLHDALDDARWNKELHKFLKSFQ